MRAAWQAGLDRVTGGDAGAMERLALELGALRARTGLDARQREAATMLAELLRRRGCEPGGAA